MRKELVCINFTNLCPVRITARIDPYRNADLDSPYDVRNSVKRVIVDGNSQEKIEIELYSVKGSFEIVTACHGLSDQNGIQAYISNIAGHKELNILFAPVDGEIMVSHRNDHQDLFNKFNVPDTKTESTYIFPMGYHEKDYDDMGDKYEHPYARKYYADKARVSYWSRVWNSYDDSTSSWPGWATFGLDLLIFILLLFIIILAVIGGIGFSIWAGKKARGQL